MCMIYCSGRVINRSFYLHMGPSSFKLSNAHAPVVPRVAHNWKKWTKITIWWWYCAEKNHSGTWYYYFQLNLQLSHLHRYFAQKSDFVLCWITTTMKNVTKVNTFSNFLFEEDGDQSNSGELVSWISSYGAFSRRFKLMKLQTVKDVLNGSGVFHMIPWMLSATSFKFKFKYTNFRHILSAWWR